MAIAAAKGRLIAVIGDEVKCVDSEFYILNANCLFL